LDIAGTSWQVQVDSYAVVEDCDSPKKIEPNHPWVYQVSLLRKNERSERTAGSDQPRAEKVVWVPARCPFDFVERCRIVSLGGIRLLLLPNESGGNLMNCGSSVVVCLQANHMLEISGNATVMKVEGSERIDLVVFEDCAEIIPPFSHAMSPKPFIYCKMKNGKLVPDEVRCLHHWRKAIARNKSEIANILKNQRCDGWQEELYRHLLDNYLMGYLAGKEKKALSTLEKGLEPMIGTKGCFFAATDTRTVFDQVEQELHEVVTRPPYATE
jgi:hypothetical protein